jgi:hypothetical protein
MPLGGASTLGQDDSSLNERAEPRYMHSLLHRRKGPRTEFCVWQEAPSPPLSRSAKPPDAKAPDLGGPGLCLWVLSSD